LFSQDLDESFLNTLPDEIRQDIITQSNDIKSLEDPVYRSIQSQTKLEKKSIEDLKNRLEADLEYLKNKLSDNGIKMNGDELPLFGKDFFSTYQSTYMPINEPNLDSSYVLDFGDILEIQLIGQKNYTDNFSLNRDGSINLPDIGQLNVGGLSLNNASSLIKARVESTFIGTKAYISLTNIRDINVLVSGNAYNPGIYTLSGNSNMLHALAVAGGINDNGSYREINLIRDEEVLETLDMYDVLITGRYKSKTKLQSGDIIFVKPSNKIVSIDGAIKIPAKYELLTNQNLSDLINYANGLTSVADLDNIFLDRILDGKVESLPIRNVKQFESIEAKDGDKVFIRKHSFRSVYIEGAVLKPGMYLMSEGESINDLINKSGGYTQNAYPFGAVYENINAKNVNKIASDKLYKEFIDNIITMSQKNPESNVDLNAIINITQNLRNNEPNGRIVIDLLNSSDADSIMIRDGDKLLIPEKPSHIYIYGEVSYEGALKFNPDNSIEDYIAKSGGFKQNADKKAIYILHPNGDTQRTLITKSLFQNNPNQNVDLYPGSVIFIPRGIDNSATNRLAAQAYVSILGNIGIALASLSSINNN
jgi:polysaccharide export outer membrane protein